MRKNLNIEFGENTTPNLVLAEILAAKEDALETINSLREYNLYLKTIYSLLSEEERVVFGPALIKASKHVIKLVRLLEVMYKKVASLFIKAKVIVQKSEEDEGNLLLSLRILITECGTEILLLVEDLQEEGEYSKRIEDVLKDIRSFIKVSQSFTADAKLTVDTDFLDDVKNDVENLK